MQVTVKQNTVLISNANKEKLKRYFKTSNKTRNFTENKFYVFSPHPSNFLYYGGFPRAFSYKDFYYLENGELFRLYNRGFSPLKRKKRFDWKEHPMCTSCDYIPYFIELDSDPFKHLAVEQEISEWLK
jgi:hypothetical protein